MDYTIKYPTKAENIYFCCQGSGCQGKGLVTGRELNETSRILATFSFSFWLLSVSFVIVLEYSYDTYTYECMHIIYNSTVIYSIQYHNYIFLKYASKHRISSEPHNNLLGLVIQGPLS